MFNETQVSVMFQSARRAKLNLDAATAARQTAAERYLRIRNKAYEAVAAKEVPEPAATEFVTEFSKSTRGKSKQAIGADWFAEELAELVGPDDTDDD